MHTAHAEAIWRLNAARNDLITKLRRHAIQIRRMLERNGTPVAETQTAILKLLAQIAGAASTHQGRVFLHSISMDNAHRQELARSGCPEDKLAKELFWLRDHVERLLMSGPLSENQNGYVLVRSLCTTIIAYPHPALCC